MPYKPDPNNPDSGRNRYPNRRRTCEFCGQDDCRLAHGWGDDFSEYKNVTYWKSKTQRLRDGDWDERS